MDKKDFADVLNNMKDLTLVQIIQIFKKLKYKTIMAVILFFVSLAGGSFVAGKYSHQQDTAVMLDRPFAMRIELDDAQHDFSKLVLIKDPASVSTKKNQMILSLRVIHSPFDTYQVGKIVATMEENKLSGIWKIILSSSASIAYAQDPIFNWNGHAQDDNYKVKLHKDKIRYYYSDGCILECRVSNDKARRVIPSSCKWIERTH